jgi:glutamyl-Q tRNA(Asp) synthetase
MPAYRGRFAPTPSGDLHLGSVLTALVSWLDARSHQGAWFLRIDDLDSPRVVPGATDAICRTLEQLGLAWDGDVVLQSRRQGLYRHGLEQCQARSVVYPCSLSRKDLQRLDRPPGPTNRQPDPAATQPVWRFALDRPPAGLEDIWLGHCPPPPEACEGDFVIWRREGFAAYPLASTVDDHDMQISHIIRGRDLLGASFRQCSLRDALDWPHPQHGHLPLLCIGQEKLAKRHQARPVCQDRPTIVLSICLTILNLPPPTELTAAPPEKLLDWALAHWRRSTVPDLASIEVPTGVKSLNN